MVIGLVLLIFAAAVTCVAREDRREERRRALRRRARLATLGEVDPLAPAHPPAETARQPSN